MRDICGIMILRGPNAQQTTIGHLCIATKVATGKAKWIMEDHIVQALSVLLLYLTSGEGSVLDHPDRQPLKAFHPEALKVLEEAGYLQRGRGVSGVTLTEAGIQRARALAAGYLGQGTEPI